jgi:predicted enzyme related to lactoylglutathione lyase
MPYFVVADADASAALLVELGGTQFDPVTHTPFGRMTHVADSSGAAFSIIESRSE